MAERLSENVEPTVAVEVAELALMNSLTAIDDVNQKAAFAVAVQYPKLRRWIVRRLFFGPHLCHLTDEEIEISSH